MAKCPSCKDDAPDNRPSGPGEEMKRKAMGECGRILRGYRLTAIVIFAALAWIATYAAGAASVIGSCRH